MMERIAKALEDIVALWSKPQPEPFGRHDLDAVLEIARRNVAVAEANAVRLDAQMRMVSAPTQYPYACPVCRGAGHVSRPPEVPGDVLTWSASSSETHPCRACGGTGVVWSPTETLPPQPSRTVRP